MQRQPGERHALPLGQSVGHHGRSPLGSQWLQVSNPTDLISVGIRSKKLVKLPEGERGRQGVPLGDGPQQIVMIPGVDGKIAWERYRVGPDEFTAEGRLLNEAAPVGNRG